MVSSSPGKVGHEYVETVQAAVGRFFPGILCMFPKSLGVILLSAQECVKPSGAMNVNKVPEV